MNPGRKNAIVIFITIAATIAIVATISTMSCSSSEPLPPIAVVVAVVAVAVVPVVAVVAFVVVAVVVAPCPWPSPSPSPWPPAGLAAGFALRVGFPCRSLLLLNGSVVGCWCGFFLGILMVGLLSFAFSCVHSLFYLRCCCVVRLLVLFWVLLWVFHQQHTRHNGHHRQAHHHGDHHHSVAVFIRKGVQPFTKAPPYSTVDARPRHSIESSTHVDGCWSFY